MRHPRSPRWQLPSLVDGRRAFTTLRRFELCARMKTETAKCPECGAESLYWTTTNSGGGYGPILLPQLGTFWQVAKFDVLVCAGCGLTRFYAHKEARAKLPTAKLWQRI